MATFSCLPITYLNVASFISPIEIKREEGKKPFEHGQQAESEGGSKGHCTQVKRTLMCFMSKQIAEDEYAVHCLYTPLNHPLDVSVTQIIE